MSSATIPGPRPQPLGVLPWPAGLLLVPEGTGPVAADLVQGKVPEVWPEGLAFYAGALEGDPAAAAALVEGTDPVARYNRAVLVGDEGAWQQLAAESTGELRALVDTARFTMGLSDQPPDVRGIAGEVAAIARSARASAALEVRDATLAVEELTLAVADALAAGSPVLAAALRLSLAELLRDAGEPARSAREADAALQALPPTADRELRAQLQMARALARQELAGTERGALLAVVADLSEAARVFREETHPELFAVCNQHLALAYLVMPMSDQGDRIRLGVAVNALRAALRVYTPDTHPIAWASTQMNLANALQYLPSAHQEQHLDESVQLYEELLAHRDPATDPIGFARILSNQGNALGHLGVFGDARDRLTQARDLFRSAGDAESAATVEEILAGVEQAAASAGRA
jgi:tetratricopeptide (TPR) repeat protein